MKQQYKVKAYNSKGFLEMSIEVTGRDMANAAKRIYIKEHHYKPENIDIVRVRK